jgi:Na+-exporting ATPase
MEKGDSEETVQHVSGQSNTPLSRPAHALAHGDVAKELKTDALDGLSPSEAASRLEKHGKNELGEAEGVQPFKIVIAQVANAMTMV